MICKNNFKYKERALPIREIAVCILASLIFSLTACSSKFTSADIIVEHNIPFSAPGNKWNEVNLLEEDDYGRQLYSYLTQKECSNVFYDYVVDDYRNKPVLLYIVCQGRDSEYVYCYEEVCYNYTDSFETPNIELIEKLKEENDWNKPINKEKSISYRIDGTDINSIRTECRYPSAQELAVTALSETLGRKIEKYRIGVIFTTEMKPIYILRELLQTIYHDGNIVFGENYIFTLNDNNEVEKYAELSDNIGNWREEINAFKREVDEEQGRQGTVLRKTGDGSKEDRGRFYVLTNSTV